ncbi:MAG: MFS transporter [Acidobacteria bacterium]|nr:MFS transporter [Acidobacteriota bacterium]MBI3280548.1 MFS transporter [Acidobacteriota bacterium]
MNARHYAWLLVGLLWVVALLNYLDRQVIFSVFPLLEADLKLTAGELGLLSTVFLWVYGILSPFAGYLADRLGRARMILVSLLVWSLVTWATGHARNFAELIMARALMGISEACYLPAALGLIADYHGPRSRSLATGLHQSGLYAGIILGGAGGGWMGERYGWRLAFTILGVAGILYFLVLRRLLKAPPRQEGETAPPPLLLSFRKLASLPGFLAMTAVFSAVSIANWIVYTWLPLYLYERFGMSLALAGFSATFYIQAASFAGILAGGWLADSWSRRTTRGRLMTQALGLAAAAPFLFVIGVTGSQALLITALIVFGLGRGLYDCNTMPTLCQIAQPDLRSTGYGIFNFAACLAGGVAAALAGYLKAAVGLGAAFETAAILLLVSAGMLARIRPGSE